MATGKRYYWMKLKESFMTSDTIDYFMSQPGGANYVVLYQMLCLKTINTEGRLSRQIGEIIIPYDTDKIQRDCKWFSIDTIRVALKLYQAVGLIYEDQDGVLVLADHNNLVGSETDYALKKRRQRDEVGQLPASLDNSGDIVPTTVPQNVPTDIRDRDKSLDIRDQISEGKSEDSTLPATEPEKSSSIPYEKIKNLYNSICVSFAKIKSIEGERRKAVGARWNKHKSLEVFKEAFTICEQSDFLRGENNRNWKADFDWIMKAGNFVKILEHKYDNSKQPASRSESTLDTINRIIAQEEGGGNG